MAGRLRTTTPHYSYDSGCYELAVSFLLDMDVPDEQFHGHAAELAQVIQDAIESHISTKELE